MQPKRPTCLLRLQIFPCYFISGHVSEINLFVFFVLVAAELLTTNKLSELACLALYLMYEKKQGKKSVWYPFIRELDRQRGRGQLAVQSPLLWSDEELAYLTGSPTKVVLFSLTENSPSNKYNIITAVYSLSLFSWLLLKLLVIFCCSG